MTIRKTATTLAAIAAVTAGSIAPLTTAASAHERDGYARNFDAPRFNRFDNGPRDFGRGGYGRRDFGYQREVHRDHSGRAIAIGIGALMLGAILASEASRH